MNTQSKADLASLLREAQASDKYLAVSVSDGLGSWGRNSLLWEATEEGLQAAQEYARDLFFRWTSAREWRIEAHEKREFDRVEGREEK